MNHFNRILLMLQLLAPGQGEPIFVVAPGSPFPVEGAPGNIGIGDFNHDGSPDLVTANGKARSLEIFLGDGRGGFRPEAGARLTFDWAPGEVAIGDVNRDGILDIALRITTVTI